MHTTIYKIGKQQGPTVEHRERLVITYEGKDSGKEYVYMYK